MDAIRFPRRDGIRLIFPPVKLLNISHHLNIYLIYASSFNTERTNIGFIKDFNFGFSLPFRNQLLEWVPL